METPLTTPLSFNYLYILDCAARQSTGKKDSAILDYGCGIAQTVVAGRARGLNIYGAEVFQNGSADRAKVAATGLLGTLVREIREDVIDFPDEQFDFIFSNQVLEHVVDIDKVLKEIHRVLKPGGKALHLFPSKDVWREGHTGIPFLHWFPKDSQLRYPYGRSLQALGFGNWEGWPLPGMLDYLDNSCFYRSRKALFTVFSKYFNITLIEDDYIRARLGQSRLHFLTPMIQWPIIKPFAKEAFRKLGGMVLLTTKRAV